MRKISDLFGIKRTPREALKIGRILNRAFQSEEGYEEHHYRWCYKNPFFKNRKKHIDTFFEKYDITSRLINDKTKYVGEVLLEKMEAKQSIVATERVNHKILGFGSHYQKNPDIDVTYPIVVYDRYEEIYYIWDGNSRIVAALLLGDEAIKCRIVYPTIFC